MRTASLIVEEDASSHRRHNHVQRHPHTTPRAQRPTTRRHRRRAIVFLIAVVAIVAIRGRGWLFRDVGLTTSRTWGTYDDDEATAIDAIVDAVLEPWRNVKIEKHMVEDAMHKVNEAQDAARFVRLRIQADWLRQFTRRA